MMSDILSEAQALIADPEHWTKDYHALDGIGHIVDPRGMYGSRYCSLGAVLHTLAVRYNAWSDAEEESVADRVAMALGFADVGDLVRWNDLVATTHDDVMARFEEARVRALTFTL